MNNASKIGIGSSVVLVISFLLPWIQILGFGASGYNLSQLGSYGNLAWVVPAVGVACLLVHTSNQSFMRARKSVCMIGALLVVGGIGFVITQISERAGEGIGHAIGIGVYVSLISSIALFISGCMAPLGPADKVVFGVTGGYIAMAIVITTVYFGAFPVLGVERVFQPDSYEISTLWIVISIVTSFGSAIFGGYICAAISKSLRACQALAAIVVILGFLLCLPAIQRSAGPNVRAGEVSILDAMRLQVAPIWMHVLNPILGAAGVLLAARMKEGPVAAALTATGPGTTEDEREI